MKTPGFENLILPLPLSKQEEKEMIINFVEHRREDARMCLIEHNLRLVVYFARRYSSEYSTLDELVSVGTVGLIKAIHSFEPLKNIRLATYASRCIKNEILMYLRKQNKTKLDISMEQSYLMLSKTLMTEEDTVFKNIEYRMELVFLERAFYKLDKKERFIIRLRFGINTYNQKRYTQKEVAKILGVSQSYLSRLEKKIIKKLKIEMDSI